MANDLNLPSPNINPGVIGGGGLAPNPIDLFLASYIDAKKQKSSESAQAREFEIQKAHLDLEKQRQKLILSQQEHAQTLQQEKGKAVQAVLKMLGPGVEQFTQTTGQLPQFLGGGPIGGQQPQGSPLAMQVAGLPAQALMQAPGPVSAPAQASPAQAPNWGAVVAGMSDEAAAAFVEHDLPNLLAAKKAMEGKPMVPQNIGGSDTLFDPNKGLFYDPSTGKLPSDPTAWVASVKRTMTEDAKAEAAARMADARARTSIANTYREAALAQNMKWHFLNSSPIKDLTKKGRILQQAVLNINDALNSPDPTKRRLLASVAILSFQSAAEVVQPQLRYQMVQWFKKNVDQSFTGKLENLGSLAAKGEYPAATYRAMVAHLTDILAQQRSEYEKQRAGEIKRHPILGGELPEADEYFTSDTPKYDVAPPPNIDEALSVTPRPPTP